MFWDRRDLKDPLVPSPLTWAGVHSTQRILCCSSPASAMFKAWSQRLAASTARDSQWPTMNTSWCGTDFSSSYKFPVVTAGVKEASLCSRIISVNPSWLVLLLKSLWGSASEVSNVPHPSMKDATNTIALHKCSEGVLGKAADLCFWVLSRDISDLYYHWALPNALQQNSTETDFWAGKMPVTYRKAKDWWTSVPYGKNMPKQGTESVCPRLLFLTLNHLIVSWHHSATALLCQQDSHSWMLKSPDFRRGIAWVIDWHSSVPNPLRTPGSREVLSHMGLCSLIPAYSDCTLTPWWLGTRPQARFARS